MKFSVGESSLLSQPPSFVKKKNYELHEVLGRGTFGKVIVSPHAMFRFRSFANFTF